MPQPLAAKSVQVDTEALKRLADVCANAGSALLDTDFIALRSAATTGATLSALGSCAGPATATLHGVGARFIATGRAIARAATDVAATDRRAASHLEPW